MVLIVSEPGPMRDSLQMALSVLPHVETVVLADTAESALLAMAERAPTLVVYDADVSVKNMEAVLAAVTQLGGKSLVIADSREQQNRATAAGANKVLLKGHRAAEVLEILENLMGQPDEKLAPGRHGAKSD